MTLSTTSTRVVGIDEAGRGAWSGPLVVGAAVEPDGVPPWWGQLDDSKLLSPRQREGLYSLMLRDGVRHALGWVSAWEIDGRGMQWAFREAVRRALFALGPIEGGRTILDGDTTAGVADECLIGADKVVPAVSAASIAAKVSRDRYVTEVDGALWPEYGFAAHKGYGTGDHRNRIAEHGSAMVHRRSFKPLRGTRVTERMARPRYRLGSLSIDHAGTPLLTLRGEKDADRDAVRHGDLRQRQVYPLDQQAISHFTLHPAFASGATAAETRYEMARVFNAWEMMKSVDDRFWRYQ